MSLYDGWTKHLKDPEERSRFLDTLRGSKTVLNRLRDMLTEKKIMMDQHETNLDTFDTPNWAYRQAYLNGFKSCLKHLLKLLEVEDDRKPTGPGKPSRES